MSKKVILSADSACDIGEVLCARYDVQIKPYHIMVGEETFIDGKEISPEELYAAWRERGILPKTAALTPADYRDYFYKWDAGEYDVVHLNLGSALSGSYNFCCMAAEQLGNVYPVDSANLSAGISLLVVKAGEMIRAGMGAKEIQQKLNEMREKSHVSFVLDTLEFMRAGGRCSTLTMIGANLLRLKPEIVVENYNGGNMSVGKKYRGVMEHALEEYVRDKLEHVKDLDTSLVFITHSGSPQSDIDLVRAEIAKYAQFEEIQVTRASGTISAHCGPRTLGVLFMTK